MLLNCNLGTQILTVTRRVSCSGTRCGAFNRKNKLTWYGSVVGHWPRNQVTCSIPSQGISSRGMEEVADHSLSLFPLALKKVNENIFVFFNTKTKFKSIQVTLVVCQRRSLGDIFLLQILVSYEHTFHYWETNISCTVSEKHSYFV